MNNVVSNIILHKNLTVAKCN